MKFNEDKYEAAFKSAAVGFEYPVEIADADRRYTRDDLLDILASFCRLDITDFKLVRQKLRAPHISYSDLGQLLGMSKEAVDKRIRKICSYSEAWRPVLRNIPMKGGRTKEEIKSE